MRYLGNKTQLLPHIDRCARRIGFTGGTVCDLFAGTGVVGRHLRAGGNRVLSTDLMYSSFVFQKVFLEVERGPDFAALREQLDLPAPAALDRVRAGTMLTARQLSPALRVIRFLEEELEPEEGILTRQYSPDGRAGRCYFRPEVARRVDAILLTLRRWRQLRWIREVEEMLLVAATIDAADRRANISGTYGAYLKSWQQNTLGQVLLRLPALVTGPKGSANRCDAFRWLGAVEADLLYIDPPYNHRQYPSNYHLLDVMARIVREPDLEAFERSIYGKTGLVPWKEQSSALCAQRGARCRDAFRELLRATSIPRVIISYNEEGIISRVEFEEMLAEYAGLRRSRLHARDILTPVPYPRFRSDADGRVSRTGAGRSYKKLSGRNRDEVHEWLFHVARNGS